MIGYLADEQNPLRGLLPPQAVPLPLRGRPYVHSTRCGRTQSLLLYAGGGYPPLQSRHIVDLTYRVLCPLSHYRDSSPKVRAICKLRTSKMREIVWVFCHQKTTRCCVIKSRVSNRLLFCASGLVDKIQARIALLQGSIHVLSVTEQNARDCVSFLPPKDNKMLRTRLNYLHSDSNSAKVSAKDFATIWNGSSLVRSTPATLSSDTGSILPPSPRNFL